VGIRAKSKLTQIIILLIISQSLIGSIETNYNSKPVTIIESKEQVNIIIESSVRDVTDRTVLLQIKQFEDFLFSEPLLESSKLFSLSAIIQSINNSNSLIYQQLCQLDVSLNENVVNGTKCEEIDIDGGTNNIPSQPTIDLIMGEMYNDDGSTKSLLKILATDTNFDSVLDNYRLIVFTHHPDFLKTQISNYVDSQSSIEVPCKLDGSGNPTISELCTWDDFGLKIKIGDRKYLEEKFSFDEQGIILKNKHICGDGHTGSLLEFCDISHVAKPSISRYILESETMAIDLISVMKIIPVIWGNWTADFESDEVKSISEDLLFCSEMGINFHTCNQQEPVHLILIKSFRNLTNNPLSLLVEDSGNYSVIWIHSNDVEVNELLSSEMNYKTIQYGIEEVDSLEINFYLILILTLLSLLVLIKITVRFKKSRNTESLS